MNSTTGSEYTENTYIHLKLIFAFAAQSSLSKVLNDNVQNAVCRRGTCAVPTRQHLCRIHKPVLGTRYSGTVPRPAPIMISLYIMKGTEVLNPRRNACDFTCVIQESITISYEQ